jgi:hypothetical protein
MTTETKMQKEVLPDTLTRRIGILTRREVETRIVAPLVDALSERFGSDGVIEIVGRVIVELAHRQGAELAETMGGCGSAEFIGTLEHWKKDGALELEILRQNETHLDFNVTRCRYAEMYRKLGVPELGPVLSCNRDFALIRGFNPNARLKRTQTIMEGASFCDFRFIFDGKDGNNPVSD